MSELNQIEIIRKQIIETGNIEPRFYVQLGIPVNPASPEAIENAKITEILTNLK